MNIVRENPDLPWNKYTLSFYKGITVHDILHLNLPNTNSKWCMMRISHCIDIQEVRDNPDEPTAIK